MNEASRKRSDKKTFSGKLNGREFDVVLGYGDRAKKFDEAFRKAMASLTDEKRREIIRRKEDIRKERLFPEWQYKMYKRHLADELGLRDAYF